VNWWEHVCRLKRFLALEGHPVAVQYSNEVPEGAALEPQVVCQSLQDARDGRVVAVHGENCRCRGGGYFLGLIPRPPEAYTFWTKVERCFGNRAVAAAYVRRVPEPPTTTLGRYVILGPAAENAEGPDLILFICSGEQAARLLGLAAFALPPSRIYSYAAHCHAAIGIPMVTGDIHVSFIDNAARHIARHLPGELVVSLPTFTLGCVADAIADCIWGEADAPFRKEEAQLAAGWERWRERGRRP